MAVALTTIADTKYRTTVKVIVSSTNSSASILDVSGLEGWQSGSLVNIAKIFWSLAPAAITNTFTLVWVGTTPKNAIELAMNSSTGEYGYQPGQPAIYPIPAPTGGTNIGDVALTNAAAAVGTIVVEFHKVINNATGAGWAG